METSTKERILSAAADVFTQCGYSGASIRDIAKIARINQSQIYHHVGNKEQLWEETKTYLFSDQKTAFPQGNYESLMDFLIDITAKFVDCAEADSRLDRLMKWQMLEQISGYMFTSKGELVLLFAMDSGSMIFR
jgi:AcrR family transcriptional regulator